MKILSISPGNGWLSRWQSKDRSDSKFLELEVMVFAVIEEEKGNSRISSFSGPTGDDAFIEGIPDDRKQDAHEDSKVFDEWPWHFQQWVKVRDPNASQVAFDRPYSE
jgi:hypothetical protein